MPEPSVLSQLLGWIVLAATLYLLARLVCHLSGEEWSDQ